MPILGSAKKPTVRIRKLRCGTKSASKIATNSAVRLGQGMIDIAGLGVRIVGPVEIADALRLAELLEPGAAAIVQHPDLDIGIVEAERAGDRLFQDLDRLVVGRDEDVDRRQLPRAAMRAAAPRDDRPRRGGRVVRRKVT